MHVGRPKTPIISRQLVVDTALEMIDEEGLRAISLRRLSEKLGVQVGSLYHHYRYKDDILRDVLQHVLAPLDPSDGPVRDWKSYFLERSKTYFRLMVEHPNLAALMFSLLPRTFGFPVEDQGAQILLDIGVPPRYVVVVREQLESAVHGVLQFSFDTALFDEVPSAYPTFAKVVAESKSVSPEERLDFAITAILDGVERRLGDWSGTDDSSPGPTNPTP